MSRLLLLPIRVLERLFRRGAAPTTEQRRIAGVLIPVRRRR